MARPHKTAIVTGAASGLGLAISKRLLEDGANVVAVDVNNERISSFKQDVSPAYPDCTLATATDVTDESALDELFGSAEDTFGGVDYLVNCAGVMDRFDGVADLEKALWDRVIAINLTAPAMLSKRAVNMMLKKDGKAKGAIVNISSIAGFRAAASGAAYAASKHGLLGLTKNTAANYGDRGIRCNAIMPGMMATNVSDAMKSGVNENGIALVRRIFPHEHSFECDTAKVAKLVSYLLSEDAEMVNGACWTVDGGQTCV